MFWGSIMSYLLTPLIGLMACWMIATSASAKSEIEEQTRREAKACVDFLAELG